MPPPTATAETARFPKAVPFIIGSEVAERFSYYGMRAILPTFLVAQFFNPSHSAVLTAGAEAPHDYQMQPKPDPRDAVQ